MASKSSAEGIKNVSLSKAVSRILQRAEKQTEADAIVSTYVDVGVLDQLDNRNSQILFGRRGTGKTHVFRVLESRLQADNDIVLYLDCRMLGSAAHFTDTEKSLPSRCISLFKDLMMSVHTELLSYIVEGDVTCGDEALQLADNFLDSVTKGQNDLRVKEVELKTEVSNSDSFGVSLGFGQKGPMVDLGSSYKGAETQAVTSVCEPVVQDSIVYPDVFGALDKCLEILDEHFVLLIDEWSSLPRDLQPILAEFIKRSVLPSSRVTVKIAALEQRSDFGYKNERDIVGFEVGADISVTQDLDEINVYDRDPESITDRYSEILYNHLKIQTVDQDFLNELGIVNSCHLPSKMFTERKTFQELGRASEGVVRDLINIFTIAFYDAKKRGRRSIDKIAVTNAARRWFEQDKSDQLTDDMQLVLKRIVNQVIGARRARSFMVARDLEQNPMLLNLFDARVIHHVSRGYADKDNPGVRYNIYTLDYGTYVDLIGTVREPQISLFEADEEVDGEELVVPFDDKRSIRRIILKAEDLTV